MQDNSSKKLLAFLLFISSSVSAFCLGILAFVLTTGELPFDITPILDETKPIVIEPKEQSLPEQPENSEDYAVLLFEELNRSKAEVETKKQKLADKENYLKALSENTKKLQNKMVEMEDNLRSLLIEIDETEIGNVKRLTKLISGLEPLIGAEMLTKLDQTLSSRVIFYMEDEKASELITAMVATGQQDQMDRALAITQELQKLTEKLEL